MTIGSGHFPLTGLRVIDLTQIYSGPYATFLLAMAGADVVKIEPPWGETRRRRLGPQGVDMPFAMLNANKRSVTLNLKTEKGGELLLRLIEKADIVVENFKPGVFERLGFGAARLRALNPRLIYASITGYGSTGRRKSYPAMDLTVQAVSGIMASTGWPDGPPLKAGAAVADLGAGIHLYGAIVTALFQRERAGVGSTVEVSMIDAVYHTLASNLGLACGENYVPRTGNKHGGLSVSPYNVYPCSDGYVAIICNTDEQWDSLVRSLKLDRLRNDSRLAEMPGRVEHMDYVDTEIARATRLHAREDLFHLLNSVGVPCGSVRDLVEVMNDEEMLATGMLQKVDHPEFGARTLPHSPLRFLDQDRVPYMPSAALGADNEAILGRELGLSMAELAALREQNAI